MRGQRGAHGWRGGRGVQAGQIARLVEPCLLTLLQEGPRHGYELMASVGRFGIEPADLDSGLVYRTLRSMERQGWLTSEWDTGRPGPARRTYSITPAGRQALAQWREGLRQTHALLDRILDPQAPEDEQV